MRQAIILQIVRAVYVAVLRDLLVKAVEDSSNDLDNFIVELLDRLLGITR